VYPLTRIATGAMGTRSRQELGRERQFAKPARFGARWNWSVGLGALLVACGARTGLEDNLNAMQPASTQADVVLPEARVLPGVQWEVTEKFTCVDGVFAKKCEQDSDCCTHACFEYKPGEKRCYGYAPPNHPCGHLPECNEPYSSCDGVRFCASGVCECEPASDILVEGSACIGMCTLSPPGAFCRWDSDCVIGPCTFQPYGQRPEGGGGRCFWCSSDADCPGSVCNTLWGVCESWYAELRNYFPEDGVRDHHRWPW